jgi:uncharacterized membrane protein YjjB (DUF3815 family)
MCPKYFKVIFNVRIKQSIYTFYQLGVALTINPVDKNGILLSQVFSILAATAIGKIGHELSKWVMKKSSVIKNNIIYFKIIVIKKMLWLLLFPNICGVVEV